MRILLVMAVLLATVSCKQENRKDDIIERQKAIRSELNHLESRSRAIFDSFEVVYSTERTDTLSKVAANALFEQFKKEYDSTFGVIAGWKKRLSSEYDSLEFELKKY